jgi:drug/metabolite transporter (DMT)-like permease
VGVFVGLLAAAFFGSGDFVGGRASRSGSTVAVLLVAQLCASVGGVAVAVTFAGDATTHDLVFGALAGSVNALGLGLLYRGLANGRMGVVAPVAAVVGAVIPVSWGLASGERPGALVVLGVAAAVVAGGLISHEAGTTGAGRLSTSVLLAIGAGAGLGTSFVLFTRTGDDSGFWPVLTARIAAAVAVGAVALVVSARGERLALDRPAARLAVFAGLFDVTATTLLLVAIREDLAAIVAPIASLAPGFTVLWAAALLHEHLSRLQVAGLVLALCGLALIAAG